MKKILIMLFALTLVLSGCSTNSPSTTSSEASLTDGVYTSTTSSVGGPLTVSVKVEGGKLASVTVDEIHDTEGICESVVARLPQMMVDSQSYNVDVVTGATLTSIFMKNAVKDAISQAGDVSAFSSSVSFKAPAQSDMDTDVVVVGGGLAGMSAALSAVGQGLNVVVVEQNAYLGGNSLVSDNYIGRAAAEPVHSNFPLANQDFQNQGLKITAVEYYGAPEMRVWADDSNGVGICSKVVADMKNIVESKGGVILTETPATGLISGDGVVTGVVAQPKGQDSFNINAKAVILATGGFAGNQELLAQYMPYAVGARLVSAGARNGDALKWVEDVDGRLVAMDAPKSSWYSVNPNTGYFGAYGTFGSHYVDSKGNLLTEVTGYSAAALEIYGLIGNEKYYVINTQAELDATGELANDITLSEYEHFQLAGSVKKVEGVQGMKDLYGLENLDATLETLGLDPNTDYLIAEVVAGFYGTYGGIDIDDASHVLNNSGEVIPGLYAAGEVIGSREYRITGAYGGGLGTGYTTGWIAGQTVAAEIK